MKNAGSKKRHSNRGGPRREGPGRAPANSATSVDGLPPGFVARVLADLGQREGEELLSSLRDRAQLGLRVNGTVGRAVDVVERLGWSAEPLPWSPEGVLLADACLAPDSAVRPHGASEASHPAAAHPWHDAGAYYLQDPAAMGVVPVLDPQPGEAILDLAAAPGGKSTYIADRLHGSGMLWSHDVDPGRAGALVGNLERWGATNVVVSHGPVSRLAPVYGTFDRVLLDAPCSGEGMFRKSRAAVDLWSTARVAEFVAIQARLLDEAVAFLKPGGVLVYSTCTFGADENEGALCSLLSRRDDIVMEGFTVAGASGGLEACGGSI
ncbi:MAG TPA: RsmB/NOP family class I SAM-dependent RNA methyltransferase, partial [Trueperaceae bacterium]|nr:RsmB/NOP family class I SAM-dependent RNA methyltransferase [Trueperaceae bacterium]